MSVVKINAITVPAERAEQLAARFAARAGQVGKSDGFEEFQLLRPTDDRTTWLVYTRWRDEESFQAWMASQAFGQAHGRPGGQAGGQEGGNPGGAPQAPGSGAPGPAAPPGGPVATGSELWNYHVEQRESR
jgi:heme-degrading monooxygenase HmoA